MNGQSKSARKAVGVEVNGVHKSFGEQGVLEDISFSVEPGEIFVIMGPSGSGKSVLLRNIIGLDRPDKGKILIDRRNASSARTHRIVATALVFQAGALLNSMSVYDNLALYPREHRLHGEKIIGEKVNRALEMLSLQDAAQKLPAELSGGMKKRVAIARALVMEPQLLLYDEPTSELDPVMGATISEIIVSVRDELKITSIVVSHSRELALSIADRVGILMDGKLLTIQRPDELRLTNDLRIQEFLNPIIDVQNPRFRQQAV